MDRSYLVVDIETVPDPSLPWDAAREGFPPPLFHAVVALGALWLDADLGFRRIGVFGDAKPGEAEADEATVLTDFARFMDRERPHLVTYNGRGFDLPVLANRCLRHGVAFRAYYADRDYRYRFSDHGHIDLADVLTDHGAARKPSLGSLAKLVGLPGKLAIDGALVESLYEQRKLPEIRSYCLQDVAQTAFLFLRCELLQGRLELSGYRERAEALWAALIDDPRVQPVLHAADRDRVLLVQDAELEP